MMFVGKQDELSSIVDSRWTRDQLGQSLVHYEEMNGGHMTFLVGKDMRFFKETAMSYVD